MRKKSLMVIVLLTATIRLFAQSGTNTSGGEASGSGGVASYTIGQVAYETHTSIAGSVTEGVQQSYLISVVVGNPEAIGIDLSVSVFPNPTTDFLQLKIENEKFESLNYQLFDLNGKFLKSEKLTGNKTLVNMSNYKPSVYFVKVIFENQLIKEFKIIKN